MTDPEPAYPAFNEAHPPLMASKDVFPPHRSAYDVIGQPMTVTGSDMNQISDKNYDWRQYLGNNSPAYRKKIKDVIAKRDAEIDHYLLVRQRYWEMDRRYQYGVDTSITITKHQGVTRHTGVVVDKSKSVTQRLSIELGLDISPSGADVPGEVPPVPPMAAMADAGGGGGGGGGGANAGFEFSHEMTETLHITNTDETTYTDETTTTIMQNFTGQTTYIHWELKEQCALERFLKGQADGQTVSTVEAITDVDYMDAFPPPKGNGGDIH